MYFMVMSQVKLKKEKQFVENTVFPGSKVADLSIAIIILLFIIY
jgi:hypothetical protein